MPPSSSAKKVARVAARSGTGRPGGAAAGNATKRRNWMFAAGIVAIILIGLGVLVFARNQNLSNSKNDTPPRAALQDGKPSDHWHAAFALNVCGKELPAIAQPPDDPLGIHTHGDGLIHIHPFTVNAAGKRATMGKFWDLVNLKVTDDGFQDPATGKVYKAGETTCGGKETELVMAYWKDGQTADGRKPDEIIRGDFANTKFTRNFTAYTLALVPKGSTDIKAPSSAAEIQSLGAADAGGSGAATSGGSGSGGSGSGSSGSSGDPTGGATGGGG